MTFKMGPLWNHFFGRVRTRWLLWKSAADAGSFESIAHQGTSAVPYTYYFFCSPGTRDLKKGKVLCDSFRMPTLQFFANC